MTLNDAQITLAVLKSVEAQANKTAAALEKVLALADEVERLQAK